HKGHKEHKGRTKNSLPDTDSPQCFLCVLCVLCGEFFCQSPRRARPYCPSFSRTSLSEVMPKFFDSSSSSAVRCTRSPRVLMPRRFMHLRARTDRFRSLTGLLRTAFSCSLIGCCGR